MPKLLHPAGVTTAIATSAAKASKASSPSQGILSTKKV